jgi:IS5 family transposase
MPMRPYVDYDTVFYHVDNFSKAFMTWWYKMVLAYQDGKKRRRREASLILSEVLTILIAFPSSGYHCFKHFYLHLQRYHRSEFPTLVSYDRFISLMQRSFPALICLMGCLRAEPTSINFVDSTPLSVCKPIRARRHKVFKGLAAWGRTSVEWFFGLKLHCVFNAAGEIVQLQITPGNVSDVKAASHLLQGVLGKVFGDKGYISKDLFESLWQQGTHLVTGVRKNMQNKLMPIMDKLLLKKRAFVESIFSSLKSSGSFEHSRHRSPTNAFCHLLAALIAYQLRTDKPTLFPSVPELPA